MIGQIHKSWSPPEKTGEVMKLKNIALTVALTIIFANISAIPADVICIKQGIMGAMNKNVPNFMGEFINKQGERCNVFSQSTNTPVTQVGVDLEAF